MCMRCDVLLLLAALASPVPEAPSPASARARQPLSLHVDETEHHQQQHVRMLDPMNSLFTPVHVGHGSVSSSVAHLINISSGGSRGNSPTMGRGMSSLPHGFSSLAAFFEILYIS